jgi:hypothetical protein
MPTHAQSSRLHGPGSSRPPTPPGAGSNATCTTVRSSDSCLWGSNCARPRRYCRGFRPLRDQLSNIVMGLTGVSESKRYPAVFIWQFLSRGGLGPALKTVARRSAVPVEIHIGIDRRVPESAEVAAYYVVAEALTKRGEVRTCVRGEGEHRSRRHELVAFHYRRRDWWCGPARRVRTRWVDRPS